MENNCFDHRVSLVCMSAALVAGSSQSPGPREELHQLHMWEEMLVLVLSESPVWRG